MRHHFTWIVALVFVFSALLVRAADWTIDVVPDSSKHGEQMIEPGKPFFVVLTNVTDHDLTLWKEWCSWGYFNLSFKFTVQGGNVIQIYKKSRDWLQNYPDAFVVGPGKHFVLMVTLEKEWEGTEALRGPILVQAVYENKYSTRPLGDQEGNPIKPAWLGQVESSPIPVTIWR